MQQRLRFWGRASPHSKSKQTRHGHEGSGLLIVFASGNRNFLRLCAGLVVSGASSRPLPAHMKRGHRHVVTAGKDGVIKIHDLKSSASAPKLINHGNLSLTCVAVSVRGKPEAPAGHRLTVVDLNLAGAA